MCSKIFMKNMSNEAKDMITVTAAVTTVYPNFVAVEHEVTSVGRSDGILAIIHAFYSLLVTVTLICCG